MTRWQRNGLWVALIHLAIVASVAGKFLLDRENYPRVWVRTVPIDPYTPFRGRYVRLNPVVEYAGVPPKENERDYGYHPVRLAIHDGKLIGTRDEDRRHTLGWWPCGASHCWVLQTPLAYFIPEHAADPARRAPGEELWVEVSLPPNGPPRPLQLGVKKDGVLTPLALR